jgi:acetyltransferase-like isoleucine patch superfamily enzyme
MKFNNRDVHISPKAYIGNNVKLGDRSSIYDNVTIGDNCVIANDVTIGEPLSGYYSRSDYENPPTVLGAGSFIRSHSIIYASCTIGSAFATGHHVIIRENSVIGDHCSIGTLSDIEGEVKIGNYCRLHSSVHISQFSCIGDFVFMYPFSVMTNDPYPPSNDIRGASLGDYTQVAVHAVILPGVKVGHNCLVGANSVVSRKIPDYSLATGDPAKVVMDIRKYAAMGKGKLYPWMNRFERGLPWEGIGFNVWMARPVIK